MKNQDEHIPKIHMVFNKLALTMISITFVLSVIFGSILIYWSGEPWGSDAGIVFPRGIIVTPNEFSVKEETKVDIVADYCKQHDTIRSEVGRELIGLDRVYILPGNTQNYPTGCVKYRVAATLPTDLSPGKYYYKYRFSFTYNPIKTTTYEFTSNTFTVNS